MLSFPILQKPVLGFGSVAGLFVVGFFQCGVGNVDSLMMNGLGKGVVLGECGREDRVEMRGGGREGWYGNVEKEEDGVEGGWVGGVGRFYPSLMCTNIQGDCIKQITRY